MTIKARPYSRELNTYQALHYIIMLIDCLVFNAVFMPFQLYHCGQCTYPSFPGVCLTSTPHNILPQPLAAFLHYHH